MGLDFLQLINPVWAKRGGGGSVYRGERERDRGSENRYRWRWTWMGHDEDRDQNLDFKPFSLLCTVKSLQSQFVVKVFFFFKVSNNSDFSEMLWFFLNKWCSDSIYFTLCKWNAFDPSIPWGQRRWRCYLFFEMLFLKEKKRHLIFMKCQPENCKPGHSFQVWVLMVRRKLLIVAKWYHQK